ncbi:MAG TPA: Tad domain-containing protein [Acidimicrobiales bacterium]|nr:Tad domain-containing protein [Acidimicrobiales bacterium]
MDGPIRRSSGDGGFTLVFFALAIVALMGIAALVVDLGYWYLHANRIQRAADSAALAGVVYMPGDTGQATTVADEVAASNGFTTGVSVITQVQDPSLNAHQLKVSITDPGVPTFFAKVFGIDSITETRSSTAEYLPPVPLGSAENSFGTGDLPLGLGNPTNIWAAVNGYCTSKENGDEFLSGFDATFNGSSFDCPANGDTLSAPATANFEYTPSGYTYDIETPDQTPGGFVQSPLTVAAYDPSYNPGGCPSGGETPDNSIGQSGTQITTTFTLYYAPDPINPPSAVNKMWTDTFATNDPGSCGQWVELGNGNGNVNGNGGGIPAGADNGTYQLVVATQADQPNSDGTNAYGLEVYPAGSPFSRCSTIPTVAWYSTTCPIIQGQSALSVYVNSSSSMGTFYLANIDSTYDNKTMDIDLFDPGEGDHYIQILDPDGNPVPFDYTTIDACSSSPPYPPSPHVGSTDCAGGPGIQFPQTTILGTSAAGTFNGQSVPDVLDVSGTIKPPTGEESASEFNDRHLQLSVTVPPGTSGWWQIVYYSNSQVSDRTTWTVSLSGSPIHLVP